MFTYFVYRGDALYVLDCVLVEVNVEVAALLNYFVRLATVTVRKFKTSLESYEPNSKFKYRVEEKSLYTAAKALSNARLNYVKK